MSWKQDQIGGALKISGNNVRVYKPGGTSIIATLSCGKKVISAMWAGNEIQINLTDGKVRLYHSNGGFRAI